MKYRKKPVIIEAVRCNAADFNGKSWDSFPFNESPKWLLDAIDMGVLKPITRNSTDYCEWQVTTLEGEHIGGPGDYLVRGIEGELYFCNPIIFVNTYEEMK